MYQFLQKNRTNILFLISKRINKLINMKDIGLILIFKLYSMLLSYDSDIVKKFKNYTKSYIQNKYTTKFRNNQA